jgi:chorismate mutase
MKMSAQTACRGVAGATLSAGENKIEVEEAVRELVLAMVQANRIDIEDLAAGFVTTAPDLSTDDAVRAIRYISPAFEYLPLAAGSDRKGPHPLIRVLLLWNTARRPREIRHVYLRGTESHRWAGVMEVAG